MTNPSDAELLVAWQGGDPGAFAEMVQRYQGPLLRHARGVLGPGSAAEDVVQDVFLQLAGAREVPPRDQPPGDRPLSAWLHTVTRNVCMDVIRSEKRRKRRERQVAEPETTAGGLHAVEAQDTKALVEQEIAKLPLGQREVLVLRLLAERSYREIAEITGKKIGTVGWLISEGLKSLSGSLTPLLREDIGTCTEGPGMGVA